jgi:hypothetical protein
MPSMYVCMYMDVEVEVQVYECVPVCMEESIMNTES